LANADAEAGEIRKRERRVFQQTRREAKVKGAWDAVQVFQTEADREYGRTPTREEYVATLMRLTGELMRTLREEGLTHLVERLAKEPAARAVALEVWRLAGAGETAAAAALLGPSAADRARLAAMLVGRDAKGNAPGNIP
jgi:hypothetical protein